MMYNAQGAGGGTPKAHAVRKPSTAGFLLSGT